MTAMFWAPKTLAAVDRLVHHSTIFEMNVDTRARYFKHAKLLVR